jgi:2-polyprenyl-3-methyl-5-hydroxy-6-metoxy-1,4-benzoquinol methylase
MAQRLDREITCTFENRSLLDLNKSKKFDLIWMGQTFHHLEPRNNVFDKLAELIKENGYIIISESNAWNPAMQLWLLKKRGYNTITEFIDESGEKHSYGVERILTPITLCEEFSKRGVKKTKVRYFRTLPNKKIADKLLNIERKIPHWFKPLFTHYNYIGEKKGAGSVP